MSEPASTVRTVKGNCAQCGNGCGYDWLCSACLREVIHGPRKAHGSIFDAIKAEIRTEVSRLKRGMRDNASPGNTEKWGVFCDRKVAMEDALAIIERHEKAAP